MAAFSTWLRAFRLRTLPLALSVVFLGGSLAGFLADVRFVSFGLALLTSLLLQILSNLANDYGDSSHGVDNAGRIGPERTVQAGLISMPMMKRAIGILVFLSFVTGLLLLWVSFGQEARPGFFIMFLLGVLAIVAALKYTMGRNPYGYAGFGDLSVFVFFGLVGVGGSFFIVSGVWRPEILFPAASLGFLSTGVLNLNNLRDEVNDRANGKISMIVKMGPNLGKWYHLFLISGAIIASIVWLVITYVEPIQLSFLLTLPLFFAHLRRVWKTSNPAGYDPELKRLAISTLVFSIVFGLTHWFLV